MSYDPLAFGSEPPFDAGPPAPPGDTGSARQRVQVPAIALIVVAILNLLFTLLQVVGTVRGALQSPEDMQRDQRMLAKFFPQEVQEQMEEQQQQQQSPAQEKLRAVVVNVILSALMVLGVVLSLLGGVRMLSLRSYGLCVAGAISAAIPCVSCSGCCGVGEIVGIWALVVLLNPDVKAAFH